jgi:hypothetical protein
VQHAAAHLVALDALEQRLEVAFAETLVALALDDLEEDRADAVLGEDLQQQLLLGLRIGVDQDAVLAQAREVLAVVGDALVDPRRSRCPACRGSSRRPRASPPPWRRCRR